MTDDDWELTENHLVLSVEALTDYDYTIVKLRPDERANRSSEDPEPPAPIFTLALPPRELNRLIAALVAARDLAAGAELPERSKR